jgi:DNA-binding MarR family transcriptional regulator
MRNAVTNRHEWLKAAAQDPDLPDRAARVAVALWQFSNDETGQLNPSITTLAKFLNKNTSTVKRAIADLADAGWMARTEGRGAGNKTNYTLLSRGKVVAFAPMEKGAEQENTARQRGANTAHKKGAGLRLYDGEKGAAVHKKGCSGAPSHNKDKQSLEQRDGLLEKFKHVRFSGNAVDGLIFVPEKNTNTLSKWDRWLLENGLPALSVYPIQKTDKQTGTMFYRLPWKQPPTDAQGIETSKSFFTDILAMEAATHAAQ